METVLEDYLVPAKFYGNELCHKIIEKDKLSRTTNSFIPYDLKGLLGPTSTWKVFKKQIEALTFIKCRENGLMAFVFQHTNGERLFLAAHPRWLWYYDSEKDPKHRCSYEIIPEYTICKLYFDLEFETQLNPFHNGVLMTETLVKIICFYIKSKFNLDADRRHIIDLDSTTAVKFSRHLIFCLPNAAFHDNYNVGKFVKYICLEIKHCIDHLEKDSHYCHDFMNKCFLGRSDVLLLKVKDAKGKCVLFCDEGVYTKNRHFRVFKSTKFGKNAPLLLSNENLYHPKDSSLKSIEEQIFLDSLITYVPDENIQVLQFSDSKERTNISFDGTKTRTFASDIVLQKNPCASPFPKVDQFISELVHPGRVWRSNYFQTSNVITYDIIGYRYCGNIGRQHRSNNIKLIVDINYHCYYQKCYDPDCLTYRSESTQLPPEIQFYLQDDLDGYFLESDCLSESKLDTKFDESLNDKELAQVADVIEQMSCSIEMEEELSPTCL